MLSGYFAVSMCYWRIGNVFLFYLFISSLLLDKFSLSKFRRKCCSAPHTVCLPNCSLPSSLCTTQWLEILNHDLRQGTCIRTWPDAEYNTIFSAPCFLFIGESRSRVIWITRAYASGFFYLEISWKLFRETVFLCKRYEITQEMWTNLTIKLYTYFQRNSHSSVKLFR